MLDKTQLTSLDDDIF